MEIKRIEIDCCEARMLPHFMSQKGIEYHKLSCVNWEADFSYLPSVEVAFAHDGENIFIHFKVQENSVRAVAEKDQDAVWQDSCVEFFSQPNPIDGIYYNLECNCTGKILLAAGDGRDNRERAPKEVTDSIMRWSSLGAEPFDEKKQITEWEVALIVPKSFYFLHEIESLSNMTIRANAYKCGDKLSVPHFVSLFSIKTNKPDFHRPEFFKELKLK